MLESAFVIGVDHHLSSLDERAALNALDIESLKEKLSLKELYVLSTCNRFEIYGVAPCIHSAKAAKTSLEDILSEKTGAKLSGHVYQKTGQDMLRHGFKVASSLESMVVGEPQILGQMKQAYKKAKDDGAIGAGLDKFLTTAFHVGKRVRHETLLSREPVSVASAAMHALKDGLPVESNPFIVVVGAGDMCTAAVKHLHAFGYTNVIVLNRTIAKAWNLVESLGYSAAPLSDLPNWASKADAIVTCVSVSKPLLNAASLATRKKALHLVDMAVPRNIEEDVTTLSGVSLIDMDALSVAVEMSKEKRASYVQDAERIINEEVEAFTRWSEARKNAHMVKHLRESFEKVRDDVLGDHSSFEAQKATRLLLNKILHHPTMMIKSGYVPSEGVEMALCLMFGLRCPRVQFLQINSDSVNKGECPFVDVMRQEGLETKTRH